LNPDSEPEMPTFPQDRGKTYGQYRGVGIRAYERIHVGIVGVQLHRKGRGIEVVGCKTDGHHQDHEQECRCAPYQSVHHPPLLICLWIENHPLVSMEQHDTFCLKANIAGDTRNTMLLLSLSL
jgi:hypothetical protein